jgi:hypothetical protein
MTRFLAAVGTPIALVALYAALQEPALFLYYAALGVVLWAFVASWMWAVWHDRAIRSESELLWREDAADLEKRLTDPATATDVVVPLPGLRSVPMQRTGYEWPPLARAIEAETTPIHDDLAVETFVESIERWGVEADQ